MSKDSKWKALVNRDADALGISYAHARRLLDEGRIGSRAIQDVLRKGPYNQPWSAVAVAMALAERGGLAGVSEQRLIWLVYRDLDALADGRRSKIHKVKSVQPNDRDEAYEDRFAYVLNTADVGLPPMPDDTLESIFGEQP